MSIEELKDDFIGMVDKAWHALEGTVDVDRARQLVHEATEALKTRVEDIALHLLSHVMDNATKPLTETPAPSGTETAPAPSNIVLGEPTVVFGEEATAAAATADPVETPAATPEAPADTVPEAAEPVTGMAPPVGQPEAGAAPAEAPAVDAPTTETTQEG